MAAEPTPDPTANFPDWLNSELMDIRLSVTDWCPAEPTEEQIGEALDKTAALVAKWAAMTPDERHAADLEYYGGDPSEIEPHSDFRQFVHTAKYSGFVQFATSLRQKPPEG